MKRATFSGIRSILCDLLLVALLLGLSGCATEAPSATGSPDLVIAAAEISEEPELVAAATETQQPNKGQNEEAEEPVIAAPAEDDGEEHPALGGVEISFDFTRMSTHASNQLAIWVDIRVKSKEISTPPRAGCSSPSSSAGAAITGSSASSFWPSSGC